MLDVNHALLAISYDCLFWGCHVTQWGYTIAQEAVQL